jgi:hypothetical protein
MAETAAAVAVEAVTGTATKRSASTAAALACASVLMALADVVGLEVGEDASAQAELSSSVRRGGVNLGSCRRCGPESMRSDADELQECMVRNEGGAATSTCGRGETTTAQR